MTDHYQEYWTAADFIDAPNAEADELRALVCKACGGTRWVCEDHPDQVAHHCEHCGGAGMPCLECNPSSRDHEIFELRAENERLRAEVDELKAAVLELVDKCIEYIRDGTDARCDAAIARMKLRRAEALARP